MSRSRCAAVAFSCVGTATLPPSAQRAWMTCLPRPTILYWPLRALGWSGEVGALPMAAAATADAPRGSTASRAVAHNAATQGRRWAIMEAPGGGRTANVELGSRHSTPRKPAVPRDTDEQDSSTRGARIARDAPARPQAESARAWNPLALPDRV